MELLGAFLTGVVGPILYLVISKHLAKQSEKRRDKVKETIEDKINNDDLHLFMKGTPLFPQCGFSSTVVQILTYLEAPFSSTNVLEDEDIREGIKEFSDWPTIPQLYYKGELIGGCDIIKEMFETGELQEELKDIINN